MCCCDVAQKCTRVVYALGVKDAPRMSVHVKAIGEVAHEKDLREQ